MCIFLNFLLAINAFIWKRYYFNKENSLLQTYSKILCLVLLIEIGPVVLEMKIFKTPNPIFLIFPNYLPFEGGSFPPFE